MDDVPERVIYYEGEGEYGIVIDQIYDAHVLRTVLEKAAEERSRRATRASQEHAVELNEKQERILRKYAERCEAIRLMEVERITRNLGLRASQG